MNVVNFGRRRVHVALVCIAVLVGCGCSSGGSSKSSTKPTTNVIASSTSKPSNATAPSSTVLVPATSTPTSVTETTLPSGPPATTPPTTPATNPVVVSDVMKAVRLVRSRGFTPHDTNDFSMPPVGGIHVIIGTATQSADGYSQQAFFFVKGRFVGTDVAGTSAGIQLAWRNNTTIALSYSVYKGNEPMCCPTGGAMIVRYRWTGTKVKPLDPVPSAASRR